MGVIVFAIYGGSILGALFLTMYALRRIDQGAPGWALPKKELTDVPQDAAAAQDPPPVDLMPGQTAPRQVSVQEAPDRLRSGEREDAPLRDVRSGGAAVPQEASKDV